MKYIEKIESAIPKAGNWIYFILEYVEKYEVDRFYVIDDEILIENVDKLIQIYSKKSISIRNNTQGFFSEVKDNFFYCKKLISRECDFENNFIRSDDENI